MINDSKEDFMNSVRIVADDWKNRTYEELMTGFLTKTIKKSTVLSIPENTPLDTKENVFKESSASIAQAAKTIINNALLDDQNTMHNVDIAHEITNPNNFSESVQKLLAEHIYNEAKDKADVLEAEFDNGEFNNFSSEAVAKHINAAYRDIGFDSSFSNGDELKRKMSTLLSLEGDNVVDSIKDSVNKLITETETKNSVVRDAVVQINEKREEIEKKVNGDSVDPNADSDSDVKEAVEKQDKKEEEERSGEGWYNRRVKNVRTYKKSDLYKVYDMSVDVDLSSEALEHTFDEDSFSREAAEQILQEFQELDGIDTDSIGTSDNVLSLSNNEDPDTFGGGEEVESIENDYVNDDGERIEVDHDKFRYDENDHKARELKDDDDDEEDDDDRHDNDDDDDNWGSSYNDDDSGDDDFDWGDDWGSEESMARDFLPLSFERLHHRSLSYNSRLPLYLAFTSDGGKMFFDEVGRRAAEMYSILSKESAPAEDIVKDSMNSEIEKKVAEVDRIKEHTDELMNNLGILGILSGTFQRTDSPVQNAINSMFNHNILRPKGSKDISSEELHEHELASIFKLGLNISEVNSEIAKKIDVQGNKSKLGYLEELLNEKMFNLEPGEKMEVEEKIKALQSVESMVSLDEAINMKAFVSKNVNKEPPPERITIDSLKDIDAYGYSFDEEIDKIKKNVEKNYHEKFKGQKSIINFDISRLVEFVVDETDTTKLDTNLYESIISKIIDKVDVSNSSEGLVVLNKARSITTAFVTADKLGMISKDEFRNIRASLIS